MNRYWVVLSGNILTGVCVSNMLKDDESSWQDLIFYKAVYKNEDFL